MTAVFNPSVKTKFTTSRRKEGKCNFESFNAIVPGKDYEGNAILKAAVELRLYGTGSTWSACLWVNSSLSKIYTSGTGSAGGYGYHKTSAAAQEAINNAGFELSESISGVGDQAIETAIKAIAAAIGYPDCPVFKAHQ